MITEQDLLLKLQKAKKVVLLEPAYKRKYLPLGLAKIATYVKRNGGEVVFQRKYTPVDEDLICVTSLFTYDCDKVFEAINSVYMLSSYSQKEIIVGGVYASLMTQNLLSKFPKLLVFQGYSQVLDECPPDYSIDWQVEEPWDKFSFVFTTRGCPNHCAYCAVWRLEPNIWINPKWKENIGDKPYVMISDNNLSAQPMSHFKDICNFLVENKKSVVFDNGFDCKHITPEFAELLAKLKFYKTGCRLAFDRIEEDGIFQKAVELLISKGVVKSHIMVYVLFNFLDTPQEAAYRMEECIRLGVRPYPQCYTPLNKTTEKNRYIGKHWTKDLAKEFRFFYLMAGYYTKMKFVDWLKNNKPHLLNDFYGKQEPSKMMSIQRMKQEGTPRFYDDISPTIQTPSGGGHLPMVVCPKKEYTLTDAEGVMQIANAVTPDTYLADGKRKRVNGKAVLTSMHERRIRRLTPVECERLQGFPDGWTAIDGASDTQRYKQLGNAVTVNVIEAIARQLNDGGNFTSVEVVE